MVSQGRAGVSVQTNVLLNVPMNPYLLSGSSVSQFASRYARRGDVVASKRVWALAKQHGHANAINHKLALEAVMQAWCNEGRPPARLQEALLLFAQGKQQKPYSLTYGALSPAFIGRFKMSEPAMH